MRATQSATTVLDGALAPADRVYRSLPPGPSADPFVFALFAVFEILLGAVYTGIGRRAIELGVEAARRRTSMKFDGRAYAQDPDIRWRIADAVLAQDGAELQVFALARDVDEQVDHGARWFAQLVGLKVRATESARVVVDNAIRVSGGGSYFSRERARAAVPRRARGDVPPVRRRVGARHARHVRAGSARGLTWSCPTSWTCPGHGCARCGRTTGRSTTRSPASRTCRSGRTTRRTSSVARGARRGWGGTWPSAPRAAAGGSSSSGRGSALGTIGLGLRNDGPHLYYAFLPAGRGLGLATEAVPRSVALGAGARRGRGERPDDGREHGERARPRAGVVPPRSTRGGARRRVGDPVVLRAGLTTYSPVTYATVG